MQKRLYEKPKSVKIFRSLENIPYNIIVPALSAEKEKKGGGDGGADNEMKSLSLLYLL